MPCGGPLKYTRAELLEAYGKKSRAGEKPLTEAHIDAIEAKQLERNPDWKKDGPLIVYWPDIANATGAGTYAGNF